MIKRLLLPGIIALSAAAVAAGSSAGPPPTGQNPFASLYQKNLDGMYLPDQSLDRVLAPDAEVDFVEIHETAAQSKTCSQRCSTTCSKTCTTTRGCSSQCKRQTDGCGGSPTPRPTAPPAAAAAAVPRTSADPIVYAIDGGTQYHGTLTCSRIGGARTAAVLLSGLGSGFEPCGACKPTVAARPLGALSGVEVGTSHFTIGSTRETVRSIQGTPTSVGGDTWTYKNSLIWFSAGKVVGFSNISGNLRVHLATPSKPDGYFQIGSTKDEVLAIHGTPAAITGTTWSYGNSLIWFQDGVVTRYSDISNNLRVR